ncbi:MAG: hypothetical protein Q9M89_04290 [Persephonella sp.]|nr:hypothetical protein [Persephonella sp.]
MFQAGSLGDSFFTSALADIIKDIKVYFYTTKASAKMIKDIPVYMSAQISDIIQNELKIPVVLASHPSDRWYLENISKLSKSKQIIFTSDSIRMFGALINFSKHLILVENLPYHIFVGLRKPATVILGGYPIWKPENYKLLNCVNNVSSVAVHSVSLEITGV